MKVQHDAPGDTVVTPLELALQFWTMSSEELPVLLQVANLIWAFATMQFVPGPAFLEALCACAARDLHLYSPQNISNTCWALATLGHTSKVCAASSCAVVSYCMHAC